MMLDPPVSVSSFLDQSGAPTRVEGRKLRGIGSIRHISPCGGISIGEHIQHLHAQTLSPSPLALAARRPRGPLLFGSPLLGNLPLRSLPACRAHLLFHVFESPFATIVWTSQIDAHLMSARLDDVVVCHLYSLSKLIIAGIGHEAERVIIR